MAATVGQWLMMIEQTFIALAARNFANAAETAKCMSGDSLFVSRRQ